MSTLLIVMWPWFVRYYPTIAVNEHVEIYAVNDGSSCILGSRDSLSSVFDDNTSIGIMGFLFGHSLYTSEVDMHSQRPQPRSRTSISGLDIRVFTELARYKTLFISK